MPVLLPAPVAAAMHPKNGSLQRARAGLGQDRRMTKQAWVIRGAKLAGKGVGGE